MKIFVIAKYTSKYGVIIYATKVTAPFESFKIDLENCYINTFYFKGKEDIKINEIYDVQTIKGENGLNYCFLV